MVFFIKKSTERIQEIIDNIFPDEKNVLVSLDKTGMEKNGIESVYDYYVLSGEAKPVEEERLYYAFMDLPDFWSVRADGCNGAIYCYGDKKANIYFREPIENRYVQRVEWMDENGQVFRIDYYNKYGFVQCCEYLGEGSVQVREFYNRKHQRILTEQSDSGKIYLYTNGLLRKYFGCREEFLKDYLIKRGLSEEKVIYVTDKCLYMNDHIKEKNRGNAEAFVLTASDNIEHIEQLIVDFPMVQFHIGANTAMSDKLNVLPQKYPNVNLYPGMSENKREEIFNRCDIYLDINYEREIFEAVERAVIHKMVVLAFDSTAHRKHLVLEQNVFSTNNYEVMKQRIGKLLNQEELCEGMVNLQYQKLKEHMDYGNI